MSWLEQDVKTGKQAHVAPPKARELDQVKAESLPVIEKEADRGQRPFETIKFQPVRSPGIYEAEFAAKEEDLIFHFWPYGYRKAKRAGTAAPWFNKKFEPTLTTSMKKVFGEQRVEIAHDKDMGSFFVKAIGWGEHQFARDLSIQVCEEVHKTLGGEG
jgi:hypothetical protein